MKLGLMKMALPIGVFGLVGLSLNACGGPDGKGNELVEAPPVECLDDSGCESSEAICASSSVGSPMLRRLTAREFEAALNDVFPELVGKWSSTLSSDSLSDAGFDNESARLLVSKQKAKEIDSTGKAVGAAAAAAIETILPCAAAADRACAGTYLDIYGRRLFRRPLNDEERERYLGFFDEALGKTDFPQAISWLTSALVHATPTVYRRELGREVEGGRKLDQYEVATALAFTFAGTTPGDALLDMAEAGELNSPEVLINVAEQLLSTPQGREQVHRFFEATLEYARVRTLTKANVPEFEALREQMFAESRAFVDEVIINRKGGLRELLNSPITFPSADLAEFYGMPAPSGDYAEVARPEGQGVGILAQGAFLSTEASTNSSSPTQRGLLVKSKLLCGELPEVPATVPDISEPQVGEQTTRQRYEELHAGSAACAGCHAGFDPLGFAFEHFDEAGRYRADEGGLTIDASGTVPDSDVSFGSQEELMSGLAEMEEVQACLSGLLKTYSFGASEPCLGETLRAEFMEGTVGFVEYLASLAGEPHFSTRR